MTDGMQYQWDLQQGFARSHGRNRLLLYRQAHSFSLARGE